MKNLAVCMLIMFVLCVATPFTNADEDKSKVEEKTEETPQTKPAKLYDLTPKFYKHMTWKENIEFKMSQTSTYYDITQSFIVSSDIKVTELKNNKPVKMSYANFGGKGLREFRMKDDDVGEDRVDEEEFKPQDYDVNVDKDYKLSGDFEGKNLDEQLFIFYPAGNFMGFAVPTSAKSVGDTWSSDTLMPINFETAKGSPEGVAFTDKKSNFTFVSVNKVDDIEVASISWTGSCKVVDSSGTGEDGSFKWKRLIKFDLTNRRLLSTKGTTTVSVDIEEDAKIELSLERTLKYENTENQKPDKEEIKPKNDDE